jgi:2-keto-3-deoxy-L-fuconate dehydrogenase
LEEGNVAEDGARGRLAGKRAIVTGGASGIGLAISKAFATEGATVHIVDRNEAQAAKAAELVSASGGVATSHSCDVSKASSVHEVFHRIFESGRVDILMNNAGIAHIGNVENTAESDFDAIYQVNVKGIYLCIQTVVGHMVEKGGGAIVNMASIAASSGLADRFAYSMSKGAVLSMTYSVARDYIGKKIRCNAISPARVHTPFVDGFLAKTYPGREAEMFGKLAASQPIGRMGEPDEVAKLALFLCSEDAAFITGADYLIDGGFTHLRG